MQSKSKITQIIATKPTVKDSFGAISQPVYRNIAFEYPDSESIADAFQQKTNGYTYSRINNPTVFDFEQKMKAAYNAQYAMAFSSGMAAMSNLFMTLAYNGANIVSSPHLFGNSFSLLNSTLKEFGVEVRFVDTDNLNEIKQAIDDNTCAFFCELITNPHLEIANLPEISKILKQKSVPMVVDTTLIPWCGMQQKELGIDLEIVSSTKYLSGGSGTLGGVILDYDSFDWSKNRKLAPIVKTGIRSAFNHKLRTEIARNFGATITPDTAFAQGVGMETVELRYKAQSESAYILAKELLKHSCVVHVNYPKLDNYKYKELADEFFIGNPGAMLTFNLATKVDCFKFMDNLKIIRRSTNLFDSKSLIIHPESTIYGTLNADMKRLIGIDETLIRLSVGLENVEDLKNDIFQALELI